MHEIPEKDELMDEKVDDDLLDKGSQITGQVFYGFKSMVTQGSRVMRCTAEIADVMTEHFDKTPPCL